jgi:adenylate cyclase
VRKRSARSCHVAYLFEGSVRWAGNRIRVSATLVDTANSFRVWSEEIDGKLDDVFAVQERVASRIVDVLHLKLSRGNDGAEPGYRNREERSPDEL